MILDTSTEEIIEDIINHEWKCYGVDLKKALENDDAREAEVKKLHDILYKIRMSMSSDEVAMAKSMGLLDSKGRACRDICFYTIVPSLVVAFLQTRESTVAICTKVPLYLKAY